MVDRIRWNTVSYLPFYYVFFQFLLLTIFNLQANILTTKDILSNLASLLLPQSLAGEYMIYWLESYNLMHAIHCSILLIAGNVAAVINISRSLLEFLLQFITWEKGRREAMKLIFSNYEGVCNMELWFEVKERVDVAISKRCSGCY